MKKIFLIMLIFASVANLNAVVQTNNGVAKGISGSNVLIDGSTSFSTEAGAGSNVGKGIVVPSVDLVNFQFDLSLADGFTFPTYFDGMIVYNNATGTTLTTGNRSATAINVEPGFYYFSNPNGASNGNVTGGVWKSVGTSAATKEFWLPSFNLEWTANATEEVDLFPIYENAFLGESARFAASPDFTASHPDKVIPGHSAGATATDFYYIVTDWDPSAITTVLVNNNGRLTYTCTSTAPTGGAYINIMMVRR